MNPSQETIVDFITGRIFPNVGAEANRQAFERILVQDKGFAKTDIAVDAPIVLEMADGMYRSSVDLVVSLEDKPIMAIKCAAGSLASREREIISAARLLEAYQIPLAVATDGAQALVWDTVSGRLLGQGLAAVPTREEAISTFRNFKGVPLAPKLSARQKLIFRSYDSMNVNVAAPPRTDPK